MTFPVPGPTTVDFLLAFAQVTHQIATERDLERAEHAETRKLADNLERDLRRTKALLVESETVRRSQAGELAIRRAVTVPAVRLHTGPPGRCRPCGIVHGHEQVAALNAGSRT